LADGSNPSSLRYIQQN